MTHSTRALLALSVFGVFPVLAGTIADGNSTLGMLGNPLYGSVFEAPYGDGTLTTDTGSVDQLYKYCWYYQVPSGTNSLMSLYDNPSQAFSGNTATITYNNAGPGVAGQNRFDAVFTIKITDGANPNQVNVACNLKFTNNSTGTNTFKLFNLFDADVNGSATDDTATVSSPGVATTTDVGGNYASYVGTGATRSEANNGFTLRGKLTGTTSELANIASYSGDAATATQWTMTLAPNETRTIQTAFAINMSASLAAVGDVYWATDNSGTWSVGNNWSAGVPNAIDGGATFGSAISSARTVNIDGTKVLGRVNFDNASRYTLGGAGGGSGTLSLQTTSGNAAINVVNGSHTIASTLKLASSTTINVANAGDTLTLAGDMYSNAGATLTKDGAGRLEVKHLRTAGLTINAGSVKVLAGATPASSASASSVKSIALPGGETPTVSLDLTNNAIVVDYDAATPIDTLNEWIAAGRNNGAWNGNGINSSSAAVNQNTAIGIAEASDLGLTSFHLQSADATSVLIAYTLMGDTNLDGAVDSQDFTRFVSGYGQTSAGKWATGDFNYDGKVNTIDFNALSGNFGQPLASSPSLGAVVPEPASLGLFGVSLLMLRRKMR